MDVPPLSPRQAYDEAVAFLLATAEQVRPEQWDAPALGEWSVRDLVGHASRAMLTTETFLGQPAAAAADFTSPGQYMVTALAAPGVAARVAQAGREAGAGLGAEPLTTLRARAAGLLPIVAAADDDRLLATPAGGLRLIDYLTTRVFELTIHTLDLAAAIGAEAAPPPAAARLTFDLAGDMALRTGKAAGVLLALTGRRALPTDFSLV